MNPLDTTAQAQRARKDTEMVAAVSYAAGKAPLVAQ